MRRLIGRENGQTMAEYAVVLALLTITTAAVFTALSGGVANAMTSVTGVRLGTATPGERRAP